MKLPGTGLIMLLVVAGSALTLSAARSRGEANEAAAASAGSAAAFNAWLNIPGVQGEAIKRGHENWIQVLSYDWGVTAATPAAGAPRSTARPTLHNVRIVKHLDRSSPVLAGAAAGGTVYPQAELVFYGAAGTSAPPLGRLRLTGVRVAASRVESAPLGASVRPTEEIELAFRTIEWSYNEIELPAGTVRRTISAGWDLDRNAAIERGGRQD